MKLRKQLDTINEDHRNDTARIREGHNIEIYKLKKEIERINKEHVETHSSFQDKLASTKEKHTYSLSDVEKTYEKKLSNLEELYTSKITDLNAKNEELHRIIASLHAQLSEVENRATYLQQEIEVRKRDQHSIDSHNSELTSQLNESRKKLRDLHEIFGSVQNVTAELSKKYDDTNIEYHRVIADNKRYELQLYDMNNMLQDAHNTLQTTTAHKDGVISKLQEQLAAAELFMHRIHTAMVQKRGEKSVIEEEIENFHVSIGAVNASSVNVPLKAVPTSLFTSPSKPFSYQSVLGNSHMQHRPMNTSPPYLQQQTTPMYHAPQAYTPINMAHQYSQQPESAAGVQQGHAPVNKSYLQQQPVQGDNTSQKLSLVAPVINSYLQQSQPPAAQVMSAPEQVQSAQQQQPQPAQGDNTLQQQGQAPVKAPSQPKQQEQVAATAPVVEPEKESEEEIRQREMKEEQQRLAAEMKRLKEEEQQKKLKAAREKEKAQAQAEMKKQAAALKKQQEELERMKKQKELNEKKAELEEAMQEKLRLETVVEEWKENFVGINGREATADERPPEVKEYVNQIKLLKTEIKSLNNEVFRLETD